MKTLNKRALSGVNWSFYVILLFLFFGIINYLSYRHYKVFDFTFSNEFTLSEQTKKFLKSLKEEIEVYVFIPPSDESYERVERFLKIFQSTTNKIKVDFIDPDREREKYELLLKKYSVTNTNSVVFATKERSKCVEKDQFIEYDFSGAGAKIKNFKGENAFLNAMYDVVDPRKVVIYFTIGHGERLSFDENGKGIQFFKERLSKEGAELKNLQTLGIKEIPKDASLVVVAGPKVPFSREEQEILLRYFEGGGNLLLLLDPLFSEGNDIVFKNCGLEELCKKFGVELQNDIVVDPEGSLFAGGAQTFYGVNYSNHKITFDLLKNKYPVIFSLSRSLKISESENENSDYSVEKLVSTSQNGWGETNLKDLKAIKKDKEDFEGSLPLAVVVENKKSGKSRMVIGGDSDIITDGLILSGVGGNTIFALNSVHYLNKMEDRISIPPKEIKSSSIVLTSTQLKVNFLIVALIYPIIFVLLGVFVYFIRRN